MRRRAPPLKVDMCASTTQAWGSAAQVCAAPPSWMGAGRRGGGCCNQAALLALPHAPHRSLPCIDRGSPQ